MLCCIAGVSPVAKAATPTATATAASPTSRNSSMKSTQGSKWTKAAGVLMAGARQSISRRPNVGEKGGGATLRGRGTSKLVEKAHRSSWKRRSSLGMIVADIRHTPTSISQHLKLKEGLKDLPWSPLNMSQFTAFGWLVDFWILVFRSFFLFWF